MKLGAFAAGHRAEIGKPGLTGKGITHPVMHLGGYAVVAEHGPRIAQPDRLALDDKAPQRVARFGD